MELYDVMRTTFAAREFTDAPLPDEDLYRILDNARFAPSGGNRQGAHVTVVRDGQTRERMVELSDRGGKRYAAQAGAGETPWNPVAPPGPTPEDIAATPVPDGLTGPLLRAPVVLVVSVDLGAVAALDQDLDRIAVVPGASIYPLVWNILLSARNEGYGGTITTQVIAREPDLKRLLGIPDQHAVAAVLPLGKPVKQLTKLRRTPVGEFVTRERYDGPPLGK